MDDSVTLSTLDCYISQVVDDCMFAKSSLKLEEHRDIMLRGMIRTLFTSILVEEMETQTQDYRFHFNWSVKVPASWWQHLKWQLFPTWLRQRFPVQTEAMTQREIRTRKLTITKYATYPQANIAVPKLGKAVFKFNVEET